MLRARYTLEAGRLRSNGTATLWQWRLRKSWFLNTLPREQAPRWWVPVSVFVWTGSPEYVLTEAGRSPPILALARSEEIRPKNQFWLPIRDTLT